MLKNKQLINFLNYEFDFKNQKQTNYKRWLESFEASIKKNAEDGCFTGLSSGYDSGALTNELRKQGFKFKTYTIPANEDIDIIKKRLVKLDEWEMEDLENPEYYKKLLTERIENAKYIIRYNGVETNMTILDDKASLGGAFMCDTASKEGRKLYLSTQGSDEILSDYALLTDQSELRGVYPNDLKEWYNFKQGCNYSYMLKEERVAGAFGIEVRYPFLDIELVQEFLWLTPELKNKNYKAPLHEYLTTNKVAFEPNVKRGFTP